MNIATRNSPIGHFALAIALSCALSACSKSGIDNGASQVVAKVNGDDVTISQLNFVLSQLGVSSQQQAKQEQSKALNSLIDLHLLAKKAVQQKLDRNPRVLQAIQYAKQQVLAQAYIDGILQAKSPDKPSATEIRDYYNNHPALFGKRRIYRLRQIQIESDLKDEQSVKDALVQAASVDQFANWLKARNIHFTVRDQIKSAEDLPLGLLPKLEHMKDGDVLDVSRDGAAVRALQLMGSEEQPLSETQATPLIERYLVNRKRLEIARAEVNRLRTAAKIEIAGSFRGTPPGGTSGVAAISVATPETHTSDSSYMDKGLSALK